MRELGNGVKKVQRKKKRNKLKTRQVGSCKEDGPRAYVIIYIYTLYYIILSFFT